MLIAILLSLQLQSSVDVQLGVDGVTKTFFAGPELGAVYCAGPSLAVGWRPRDDVWLQARTTFAPMFFGVAVVPGFAFYPTFDSVIFRFAAIPTRVVGGWSTDVFDNLRLDLGGGVWADFVGAPVGAGTWAAGVEPALALSFDLTAHTHVELRAELLVAIAPLVHAELITGAAFAIDLPE